MESREDGLLEAFTRNQDSFLFFIIFFTGFTSLVISRINFAVGAFECGAGLVLLMTGYAFLIGGTRRFRITVEAAADNSYFLGFMFTISSLAVSLYRYSDGGSVGTESVISDLSIGLATTLWGLLLRIWFSQLSWNPDGVQEKIRMDLLVAAEKSRTDMQAISELITQSRVLVQQAIDEIREVIKTSGSALARNVQSLSNKVERVDVPEDLVTARLSPALEVISESVSEFAIKIEAIELPRDLISGKLDDFITSLNKSVDNGIDLVANQVSAHTRHRLGEGIAEVTKEFAVLVGNLDVPADLIESRLVPIADDLKSQLSGFSEGLAEASLSFQEELGKISQVFSELTESESDFKEHLLTIKALVENASGKFEGLSEEASGHMIGLTNSLSQAVTTLSNKVSELNDLPAADPTAFAAVESSASSAADATALITGNLITLAPTIDALNEKTSNLVTVIDKAVETLNRLERSSSEKVTEAERLNAQSTPS